MNDTLEPQKPASYVGMPALQVEKYKSHMDGLDMTDAQKEEYLKTLWSIMASFVRLGWGVERIPPFLTAFNNASLSAENMPHNDQSALASDFNGNADGTLKMEIKEP